MASATPLPPPRAALALGLWLATALAFLVYAALVAAPFAPVFAALDADAPALAALLMALGQKLRTPLGIGVAAAAVTATALPYARGARGEKASRRYLWAAVAMCVATTLGHFAVQVPAAKLQGKLRELPPLVRPLPPR
jgi:hypothetical protein